MIPSVVSPYSFFDNLKIIGGLFSRQRDRFMKEFQAITQHQYNFDISSGRAALLLILTSLKTLQPGKKYVLVSALTCDSVGLAVRSSGLTPVYYDIDSITFTPDITDVEKKINQDTLAVVSSSLFGYTSQLDHLSVLCRSNNIFFIEDNAHVLGLDYKGKIAGHSGDACFYSFGPSKSISMISGGMASTNDKHIAEAIGKNSVQIKKSTIQNSFSILLKHFSFYLFSRPFIFSFLRKFKNEFRHFPREIRLHRMNNVQYSIGKNGLRKYWNRNQIRQKNTKYWSELLRDFSVQLQPECSEKTYVRFPFLAPTPEQREQLISKFRSKGVWAVRCIFNPNHSIESQNDHAKDVFERMILLPTGQRIRKIVFENIKKMLEHHEN